jgi:hypothetical protein
MRAKLGIRNKPNSETNKMSQEDFQQQVLRKFEELKTDFEGLKTDIDNRFTKLEFDIKEANIRLDAYQKSSGQIVNLAFGLIASATIITVISSVFKR